MKSSSLELSNSIAALLLFYLQILQINPLSLHMIGPQHERDIEEQLPATGQQLGSLHTIGGHGSQEHARRYMTIVT